MVAAPNMLHLLLVAYSCWISYYLNYPSLIIIRFTIMIKVRLNHLGNFKIFVKASSQLGCSGISDQKVDAKQTSGFDREKI